MCRILVRSVDVDGCAARTLMKRSHKCEQRSSATNNNGSTAPPQPPQQNNKYNDNNSVPWKVTHTRTHTHMCTCTRIESESEPSESRRRRHCSVSLSCGGVKSVRVVRAGIISGWNERNEVGERSGKSACKFLLFSIVYTSSLSWFAVY